jgi:5-methyltetrahydropteroyltriglutamate--homocysteine methyltransferase
MRRSTDRILTTHTGSLPRPDDLLAMLRAKEMGHPYDAEALAARVRSAVGVTVRAQLDAGIDIVGDGEMSKASYATYVKDRLVGFEGEVVSTMSRDVADFPGYIARMRRQNPIDEFKRPACSGPVAYRDHAAMRRDIDDLKAAVTSANVAEAFMTAASPGVIATFLGNQYYKTDEAYLAALADVMRVEYQAICDAGFILQLDCPDLAMARHMKFADLSVAEFRKQIELHIEALNHALAGIPPDRVRMHLCWGNYEGPHHRDIPLRDIIDIVFKARPMGILYEAANPRHEHEWAIFKDVKLPDGKVLIPGVLDSTTNFIEHPELVAQRICNVARLVGRENVIAGTDCGFATWARAQFPVEPQITWAKLRAMSDGARLAAQELWG